MVAAAPAPMLSLALFAAVPTAKHLAHCWLTSPLPVTSQSRLPQRKAASEVAFFPRPIYPFPRCLLANLLLNRLWGDGDGAVVMVVAAVAAEPWGRLGSASRYRGRFELASLPPPPWRVGLTIGESLAPVSPPPDAKAVFQRVTSFCRSFCRSFNL